MTNMGKPFKINIFNVINSPFCIAPEDGHKIYELIVGALKEDKPVQLSFLNITMVITAFLNEAIGVLYKDFTPEMIDKVEYLDVSEDLKESFDASLDKVKSGAPIYYRHQQELDESTKNILGE